MAERLLVAGARERPHAGALVELARMDQERRLLHAEPARLVPRDRAAAGSPAMVKRARRLACTAPSSD
jgi:hypothetical protein